MKKVFILVVCLAACSIAWCEANTVEKYWISFNSSKTKDIPHAPGGPKYLLQIDVFGNITVFPKKIIQNSPFYRSPSTAGIAISSHSEDSLNVWVPDARLLPNGQFAVFRAVINKQTLRTILFRQTTLKTNNPRFIQVTQKAKNNFLALQIYDPEQQAIEYVAFGISSLGIPLPLSWPLSKNPSDCEGCAYALSADGKFIVVADLITDPNANKKRFLVQRLGINGLPVNNAIPLPTGRLASVLDISGPLSNGRRYVIYSQDLGLNQHLFLQVIDSEGVRIGERILLGADVANFQAGAIEPKGRFVVYVTNKNGLGELVYQALDGTGHPSGQVRKLAANVADGVDVMREP